MSSCLANTPMVMTSKPRRDLKESPRPQRVGSHSALFEFDFVLWPPMAQLTARGAPEADEWRAAVATVSALHLPGDAPVLCDLRGVTRLKASVRGELVPLVATRRVAFVTRAGAAPRLARQLSFANAPGVLLVTDYGTALRWLLFADDTIQPRKKAR